MLVNGVEYHDESVDFAKSTVMTYFDKGCRNNFERAVEIADHDFGYVNSDLLLWTYERANSLTGNISYKQYYTDTSIRIRALRNASRRSILVRMQYGEYSPIGRQELINLDGDREYDIMQFVEHECGIVPSWDIPSIVKSNLTCIPTQTLKSDLAHIKHSYLKSHWSKRKHKVIKTWITMFNIALETEVNNRDGLQASGYK